MTSVLDILINEIANVLGISAADVKSKFTNDQLNELLALSLCEPDSEVGVPLTITEPPCEEPSPAANLLSPINVEITPNIPTSNVERCIESVAEVNSQIAAQNAQNAKAANLQNGLFGLGSSAVLGAGGLGNLGSSILGGATTLGGLLGLGGNAASWAAQPDGGQAAQTVADFYGSTYDPFAGWSI